MNIPEKKMKNQRIQKTELETEEQTDRRPGSTRPDLYIAVVLYQKNIQEIRSFDRFLVFMEQYGNVRLLLLDNSDEKYRSANRAFFLREFGAEQAKTAETGEDAWLSGINRIFYRDNGGNIGLSRAYNAALSFVFRFEKKQQEGQWIFWADDDTLFSAEYLDNVRKEIQHQEQNNALLPEKTGGAAASFCPLVTGLIPGISPFYRQIIRNADPANQIHEPGEFENIYCINSGLCVRVSLYREVGLYDERLFLDMVDFLFCEKLMKKNLCRVSVVQGEIRQNLASGTERNRDRQKARYRLFRRDWKEYCKITQKSVFYYGIILLKRFLRVFIA